MPATWPQKCKLNYTLMNANQMDRDARKECEHEPDRLDESVRVLVGWNARGIALNDAFVNAVRPFLPRMQSWFGFARGLD